jgi:hypothetical protein
VGELLAPLLGPPATAATTPRDALATAPDGSPPWTLSGAGGRTLLSWRDRPDEVVVFLGPRSRPVEQVEALLVALAPLLGTRPTGSLAPPDAPPSATSHDAWLRDGARLDAELCAGRLRFFPDVRAAFTTHLLTRDVLQAALERGLGRHAGVYAHLATDWGIEPYQRWMDFLRRNGALLNFRTFRGAGGRRD